MTNLNATFDVSEFELRNYTNPYLSPEQSQEVALTEERVNSQLDFLAQMLGWNGANYWGSLAETVNQKRQLLSGTFGVYNSYVIPRIYEIRNWDNKIVVDRLQFLEPGRQTQVAKIVLGDDTYALQGVEEDGDRYIISLGELPQSFFDQIANNVPLQVDIPTYRPAPFYRPSIGISGDASFLCKLSESNELVLYPSYDTGHLFPYITKIFFANATYYFNQPVYFAKDSTLAAAIEPRYDAERALWALTIPANTVTSPGITGYLVLANTGATPATNASTEVLIQIWSDPSDWNAQNVLNNFRGVWGNKGGDLPFNFVFDALSIHGLNEQVSVTLPKVERTLDFNDVVNHVYYQKTVTSSLAPGGASIGDLWWNNTTGALAVWIPDTTGCAAWVEIDYRDSPRLPAPPQVIYPDVTAFRAAAGTLPQGAIIRINNTIGLDTTDNVIGLQGLLKGSAAVVMCRMTEDPYWTAEAFYYTTVTNFNYDALLLPQEVPVTIFNSSGLQPDNGGYTVGNLAITVSGDYDIILKKFYNNRYWEIFPDSLLKYIANSALFGSPLQGQMWWDFVNADPNTRAATLFNTYPHPATALSIDYPGEKLPDGVYLGVPLVNLTGTGGKATANITIAGGQATAVTLVDQGDKYSEGDFLGADPDVHPELVGAVFKVDSTLGQMWVSLNQHPQSGAPAPVLNLGVVKLYGNGQLLQPGVSQITDDYVFTYTEDAAQGQYSFTYEPRTFEGRVNLPTVTISDAITTAYRADITELVFSGLTYEMSPCVYNVETPLRLWKAQALQVAETVAHLDEDNYINPLLADINNGPGPDNWEKYFVRLPLEYGRNEAAWQKVALICQDFGYWGSSIEPEKMKCPPEDDLPAIYEELFLYDTPIPDYTYVYSEPYLYSNLAFSNNVETGSYRNAGIFPASDVQFDEFSEAELKDYDPLHNRQADVTSPVNNGYGNWLGEYVNINPCLPLTGFFTTDLENGGIEPVAAPVWDASIYKFAPSCENDPASYNVDANHYRVGYAYFAADASAAEDAFFDITQEASWRYPTTQPKTLYLTPR